ncbi:MAG: N-linked glycosylation glycosyltransferase PglG [uncultured Sulfurovum sp.]|uniref:N-linked glycosylation glycosyltransferase PglG n=1 Tax=uncultured Sulfurovum sp. TaxID=269237 RepID=A0A6S6SMP7_9BACT|nr:MAG: N-linked glycosylation glycosyltransferase PglG [uncultured Sulfurovum sp.]
MKEFIEVYKLHQENIEALIMNTLKNNSTIHNEIEIYEEHFKTFPSMELLYITDENSLQTTANIYRNKSDEEGRGQNRTYLEKKLTKKNEQFSFSEPYLSSATGNICITVMKREKNHNVFIDFSLSQLIGRLGLIELHPTFDTFLKLFYQVIGFSLMFFAFLAIGYALFSFFTHLIDDGFTIDALFKPIVSITLGLAIFDLAKTILEREVYFKSYGKKSEDDKLLKKFSIAIIIALSIEALMVVFKIALHDYTDMIHALYLIVGIGVIISSLGIYNYLSNKKEEKNREV